MLTAMDNRFHCKYLKYVHKKEKIQAYVFPQFHWENISSLYLLCAHGKLICHQASTAKTLNKMKNGF